MTSIPAENNGKMMVVQAPPRPATSLRLLLDTAAEHGLDRMACLDKTAINPVDLESTTAQFSVQQEIQIIENVVKLTNGMPGTGMALANKLHVHAFGIWGFALLTSPTLRAAIETSIEFIALSFVIARLSLHEQGSDARIEFDMTDLPSSIHDFLLERHAMVAKNFMSELMATDNDQIFRVETCNPDVNHARELSRLTGLPVTPDQAAYALVFPANLLDLPLPKSDPVSLQFCLDQCKARMEDIKGSLPPWSQKVRDAVIDQIGSEQHIEDISEKLSVTERTLRRRLTDEGTNFRELYTDARMSMAHELLSVAGLNVETVSWRVGYAEPASFVRAFSKKYGKTPGDVRKKKAG